MQLTTLLFSISTIFSIAEAFPKTSLEPTQLLQRRSYVSTWLNKISSFRQSLAIAPNCFNEVDGKIVVCPEPEDCYLGYRLEEHIYIDCVAVNICTFNKWEGTNCTRGDNSDEVCQQSEDEIIDTIAKNMNIERALAAEKLATLLENDAKGVTYTDLCKSGTSSKATSTTTTTTSSSSIVSPPTETPTETPDVVVAPVLPPVEEPKKGVSSEVENTTSSTTTIKVKLTSTVTITPTPSSSTSESAVLAPTPKPTKQGPGYGRIHGGPRKYKSCYWNSGCEGLDPVNY